tara:strand:- start:5812 stop:5955 length:144 start_codon:yes stop_codon:yes gene_type:complete
MEKVKTRKYLWRQLVDKAAGPEEPIPVYNFPTRKFYENPKRPYGTKK